MKTACRATALAIAGLVLAVGGGCDAGSGRGAATPAPAPAEPVAPVAAAPDSPADPGPAPTGAAAAPDAPASPEPPPTAAAAPDSPAAAGAAPLAVVFCEDGLAVPEPVAGDLETECPYSVATEARDARGGDGADLDVRVWQREGNLASLFVSARPGGGSWEALGTISLAPDDGVTASGRLRYGDLALDVPRPGDGPPLAIELRVWQQLPAPWGTSAQRLPDAGSTYIGARVAGGSWDSLGMIPLPLAGRLGSDGAFRYGDIALRVPLPGGDADRALPTATVVLADGYSTVERITWRQRIEEEYAITTAFFAHRYGLTAEDVTLVMSDSKEPAAYESGVVALTEGDLRSIGWGYALALHEELSGGASPPQWLLSGMAEHFTAVHGFAAGWRATEPGVERDIRDARGAAEPLRSDTDIRDCGVSGIAGLATARLVERAGEGALWEFSRLLRGARSWEVAFAEAFGVSIDTFYEAFDAYRREVAPPHPHIQGVIVGADGVPARDLEVWAAAPDSSAWIDPTGADGAFSVAAGSSPIELFVTHARCGIIGYYDGVGGLVGWRDFDARAAIEVGNAGVGGLTIVLPIDPDTPCVDDGTGWWKAPEGVDEAGPPSLYRISGVVLGPDREPVEGVYVKADGGRGANVRRDETGADGTFTLLTPPGWYKLGVRVYLPSGSSRAGWYGGESGFTIRRQQITLVGVDGEDVTGIVVNLPEFR